MKQLIIQNDMELIALEEILENHPHYLKYENAKLSSISEQFRKETLAKIKQILNPMTKVQEIQKR